MGCGVSKVRTGESNHPQVVRKRTVRRKSKPVGKERRKKSRKSSKRFVNPVKDRVYKEDKIDKIWGSQGKQAIQKNKIVPRDLKNPIRAQNWPEALSKRG